MKKRLRKKKYLKEFAVYGFGLDVLTDGSRDKYVLFDATTRLCRQFKWHCGGSFGDYGASFYICEDRAGSGMRDTNENGRVVDQVFVQELLATPSVVYANAGPIHLADRTVDPAGQWSSWYESISRSFLSDWGNAHGRHPMTGTQRFAIHARPRMLGNHALLSGCTPELPNRALGMQNSVQTAIHAAALRRFWWQWLR